MKAAAARLCLDPPLAWNEIRKGFPTAAAAVKTAAFVVLRARTNTHWVVQSS